MLIESNALFTVPKSINHTVFIYMKSDSNTSVQDMRNTEAPYVREEGDTIKTYYTPYAEFAKETPEYISAFVEEIEKCSGFPRSDDHYPIDSNSIQIAAKAFEQAAKTVFGFTLSLESDEALQLDIFANAHLIDPRIRPYFHEEKLKEDLDEEQWEAYSKLYDEITLPKEPLLYYAMGCFLGEWLVRYRNCTWMLFESLNPIQSFPDMAMTLDTACMLPFSQVVKKLTDPEGDNIGFKASMRLSMKQYFGPFPLIASLGDLKQAATILLPQEAVIASEKASNGEHEEAFQLYTKAIEREPNNARIYSLALPSAWQLEHWDTFFEWSEAALELEPENTVINHNLAVLYSYRENGMSKAIELLKKAIQSDSNYGSAHLTIAICYFEIGDKNQALEHAKWVEEHDQKLKERAVELIKSINAQ